MMFVVCRLNSSLVLYKDFDFLILSSSYLDMEVIDFDNRRLQLSLKGLLASLPNMTVYNTSVKNKITTVLRIFV